MKKVFIKLLIFIVLFGSFSYAAFHDEELHHHVHAYEAGDVYGTCPSCTTGTMVVTTGYNSGCIESGAFTAVCDSCGYSFSGTTPPLGHDYFTLTEEPATCTKNGIRHERCSRCEEPRETTIPALGHSYNKTVIKEATCTQSGEDYYECTRCGNSYTETVEALGHNYKSKVTKEATCEEEGERTYTCSRCKKEYTKIIEALGHDIEYEEKEATCTEDGYKKGTCKRCNKEVNDIYPALGHDLEYVILKAATCEEEGERQAACKRCGETWNEKILPAGHKYPKEWTLVKEPSYTEEGLETKTCYYCGNVLSHILAKKSPAPIVVTTGGTAAVVGGGLWMYLKKRKAAQLVKEAAKKLRGFEKPSFEDKSVLVSSKDEDLLAILKNKSFLEVSTCEDDEIEETAEENSPDLIIMDVLSEERYDELLQQKKEALAEQNIAVMTTDEFIKDHKRKLNNRVKDKTIINYLPYKPDEISVMLKFFLPILKPDLKSDESLSNIGAAADFLGIPGISEVINVYVSARDIKATLESEEIGTSEAATIIGDIASILGLDTVASVAGLVDDIDSIKAATDKEAGAYEHKGGISGAKDIVDVVSDLIDKD